MNNNLIDIIRRFQTHHALQEECARTWVPVHSDFKVPNEADQTKNLMIPGFNETNDQQSSQDRRET
jgi:hypothetical protein